MVPVIGVDDGASSLCIYLLDPSVSGWDREFNGVGPLGLQGKTGALLGFGIDSSGEAFGGQPDSVGVVGARSGMPLCQPAVLEGGVVTRKDDYWRRIKVRLDIVNNRCDVTIGEQIVLADVKLEGVTIPKIMCVAVIAGTRGGKSNYICVNKLKLKCHDDRTNSKWNDWDLVSSTSRTNSSIAEDSRQSSMTDRSRQTGSSSSVTAISSGTLSASSTRGDSLTDLHHDQH